MAITKEIVNERLADRGNIARISHHKVDKLDEKEESVPVEVQGIVVPVVSPIGLMLLKLVTWTERR